MENISGSKFGSPLIIAVIVAGLFYLVGQYILSQPQRQQKEIDSKREITITGSGDATAKPDIAKISIGVNTGPQTTAVAAMNLLTQRFDAVMSAVKKQGVKTEDVKATNISVNPQYDWNEGKQTLRGFEASETIQVKIRDLSKIGVILTETTAQGANNSGNLVFEIDDPEKLQTQAQEEAIENAQQKAKDLAKKLGVSLGRIKTFSASNNFPTYNAAVGMGGDVALEKSVAPPVPSGTQEIQATVFITYELN